MSEDKLSQEARKAYADSQKESDEAAARDAEKAAESKESPDKGEGKGSSKSKKGKKDKGSAESNSAPGGETGEGDVPGESGDKKLEGEGADLEGDLALAQENRIESLNKELEAAKDDLAHARADLYNLQQEYNNFAKRTKAEVPLQQELGVASVVNALMSVLDDIDLARQHDDLSGTFGAVATKLESTLETRFKVKRFGTVGDAFDPNLHQAIQMAEGAEGASEQVIDAVAQPGYLMGERVLRAAMVVVGAGSAAESGAKDAKAAESGAEDNKDKGDE